MPEGSRQLRPEDPIYRMKGHLRHILVDLARDSKAMAESWTEDEMETGYYRSSHNKVTN